MREECISLLGVSKQVSHSTYTSGELCTVVLLNLPCHVCFTLVSVQASLKEQQLGDLSIQIYDLEICF